MYFGHASVATGILLCWLFIIFQPGRIFRSNLRVREIWCGAGLLILGLALRWAYGQAGFGIFLVTLSVAIATARVFTPRSFGLILLGSVMNCSVILVNGSRMPVAHPGVLSSTYVSLTSATHLWFLADILPFLDAAGNIIGWYSVGDLCLLAGQLTLCAQSILWRTR